MRKNRKTAAVLFTALALVFACGCTKPDEPNNGGGGGNNGNTYNGHEYVDLGLPSGTLWATCNVGADTPEGFGDYYAWGETTPKTTYDWSNYKYCNGGEDQLIKYCSNEEYGYNGFTDNLTELQPTDDAATANWGNGWCIPTKEQWEEFFANTAMSQSMQNGVKVFVFTSSNGKSLFLPVAGEWGNDEIDLSYWANSKDEWPSYFGNCFYSHYGLSPFINVRYRCHGLSIRPVRSTH